METLWIDYNYKDKLYWTFAMQVAGSSRYHIGVTENLLELAARLSGMKVVLVQPFVVESEAIMLKNFLVNTQAYKGLKITSSGQHAKVIREFQEARDSMMPAVHVNAIA